MATRTHAITHSAVFLRSLSGRLSDSLLCAKLQHELLHGVAAQDAFIALFDACPEFEEYANDLREPLTSDSDPPSLGPETRRRDRTHEHTLHGGA